MVQLINLEFVWIIPLICPGPFLLANFFDFFFGGFMVNEYGFSSPFTPHFVNRVLI